METRIQTNIPSKKCMENFSCIGWVNWPLPLAVPAILPYTEVYLASSDMEGGGDLDPRGYSGPSPDIRNLGKVSLAHSLPPARPPPDFRWPGPTWGEGSRPMGARVLGRQRLAR